MRTPSAICRKWCCTCSLCAICHSFLVQNPRTLSWCLRLWQPLGWRNVHPHGRLGATVTDLHTTGPGHEFLPHLNAKLPLPNLISKFLKPRNREWFRMKDQHFMLARGLGNLSPTKGICKLKLETSLPETLHQAGLGGSGVQ